MKITKIFPFLLIVFVLIFLGVSRIYAQQGLPTITIACENRNGLLRAFDDGFSLLKKCPSNSRRVIIIGEKGDPGYTPTKEVNVCFDVSTGNLKVLQGSTCFPHVRWKIPVKCVSGEPCKPDNPNDSYYINNN